MHVSLCFNSDECQSKVRLLGGLRALINVLKQHASQESPTCTDQDLYFIEHVFSTIGAAIAGHGKSLKTSFLGVSNKR